MVIEVHAKDIVSELVAEGVEDETSFSWLAQLRYYWEHSAVMVRQTNACLAYGSAPPPPVYGAACNLPLPAQVDRRASRNFRSCSF